MRQDPSAPSKNWVRFFKKANRRRGANAPHPPASDIALRLSRRKPVEMSHHASPLDARQRQIVDKLVQASRYMESIYWQQSDPPGPPHLSLHLGERLKRFRVFHKVQWH